MVEVTCELPEDPVLAPVKYVICGNPVCDRIDRRITDGERVSSAEFKQAGCYYCLDDPNAANRVFNDQSLSNWRDQVKDRCTDGEDPGPSPRSDGFAPD